MIRFVVDASVVLSWCFPDENIGLARRVALMFRGGDSAIAPSFWAHEVLNALLVGEKRKRISNSLVQTFLADLAMLPVQLENLPADAVFDRIQKLSRRHGLTVIDAAYLELAEINGLPLATLDSDLIRACGGGRNRAAMSYEGSGKARATIQGIKDEGVFVRVRAAVVANRRNGEP